MTEAFDIDNGVKRGLKTVSEQIAARQRALEDIDRAKFGWYHIRHDFLSVIVLISRAIMVAGSGFFTDAYDIFSINMGMISFLFLG